MRNKRNILYACLTLVVLVSCRRQEPEEWEPTDTRGLMQVTVREQSGLPEDKMKTVRFIVFNNPYGTNLLELNALFTIPDPLPGQEVSKFDIILEVKQRAGAINTKMVVALINEPTELTSLLDALTDYNQLTDMQLNLADFLTVNHTTIENGKLMPMTGVVVTDKVYPTQSRAEADPVKLLVNRAVARVDIYLNKEPGLDISLATGTKIDLDNTYSSQYLLRHENGGDIYGKLQTVSSGWTTKTWQLRSTDSPELPEKGSAGTGRLACSFYTPERTCTAAGNTDKLVLDIQVVSNEGTTRRGKVTIDRMRLQGVDTDVDRITRNTIYRVVTTVGANGLASTVQDWNVEDIHTEF